MDRTLKFAKGEVLIFTTGEYPDFGISGFLVCIKECDLPALAKQYTDEGADRESWDLPSHEGFSGWLVAHGHAMPLEARTVHLGSYERWEDEFGIKERSPW